MKGFRINKERAKRLIELIDKCGGMCPCAIVKDDSTLCPCDNFINEKDCQCGFYERIEEIKDGE